MTGEDMRACRGREPAGDDRRRWWWWAEWRAGLAWAPANSLPAAVAAALPGGDRCGDYIFYPTRAAAVAALAAVVRDLGAEAGGGAMTDDVRAALRRVGRYWGLRDAGLDAISATVSVYGRVDERGHSPGEDDAKVIRLALATFPADDDTPVDAAWLEGIGFGPAANEAWVWMKGPACWVAACVPGLHTWKVCEYDDPDAGHTCDVTIPTPKTRGHVRRLLMALGLGVTR